MSSFYVGKQVLYNQGSNPFCGVSGHDPNRKIQLDEHVQAIAKILYADADRSQMTNLAEIEAGIRDQLQQHMSPQLGVFL
jgi:hypothetical protein